MNFKTTDTPKKEDGFFDTSFFIEYKKNNIEIDIDAEFPISRYRRLVQDTFVDEFWAPGNDSQKLNAAKLYEEKKLLLQKDISQILLEEYHYGPNINSIITDQSTTIPFLNLKHKIQNILEDKYQTNFLARKTAKENQWRLIPNFDEAVVIINPSDVYNEINRLITDNIPFTIPLDSFGHFSLRIINNKCYLSSSTEIIPINESPKRFSNLKLDMPTIFNVIVYGVFENYLMRPGNKKNLEKPFEITLDGSCVKISKNLLPDFRISIPALHYCDVFVTCDAHQATLIRLLYPHYGTKIKLIPLKNSQ
jgi:hypothetical protein